MVDLLIDLIIGQVNIPLFILNKKKKEVLFMQKLTSIYQSNKNSSFSLPNKKNKAKINR
jgi:hypothetical protein